MSARVTRGSEARRNATAAAGQRCANVGGKVIMRHLVSSLCAVALGTVLLTVTTPALAASTVTIIPTDPAGVGFNDPTPAAPVGGNAGTTVGQQRLIAFRYAASLWAARLDSAVAIRVSASFPALTCTATQAILGSAGTTSIFAFAGGSPTVIPNVWYPVALANKLTGVDLFDPNAHIIARFNRNVGVGTCLPGTSWYYGLDANEGPTQFDLVAVVLHELTHGLGFSQFANVTTGTRILDLGDVYAAYLLDTTTGKTWNEMTNAERAASAINTRRLVWTGSQVHADAPSVLQAGTPQLRITSPAGIAGVYLVGTAAFGPQLTAAGVAGQVAQALDPADAAGPSTSDACSPLTNGAAVAGRIALVDRGTCGFTVKVKNAQNAGAIAVLVADNVAGSPPANLGGADPTITIPAVRITLADGNTIKAQLGAGVLANLDVDPSLLSGADGLGRLYMNTPNPVEPGSSVSHWDPLTFPNQLMEPAINSDLAHSVVPPRDLTLSLLRDIGWFPDADVDGFADDVDDCDASDKRSTVFIGSVDTGIVNLMFTNGCTMNDEILGAADDADNHGAFVSRVAHLGEAWLGAGLITDDQREFMQSTAGKSKIGK
jgi:hypothetical protein